MLAEPRPDDRKTTHLLQCYQADENVLIANAARFLKEGLELGHSLVVIATPEHRAAFVRELKRIGAISPSGSSRGGLTLLDADDTLARLLVADMPDARRFDEIIGGLIRAATSRNGATGVHAYGDMVGELWKAKRYDAATRLENLWNELRRAVDLDLFCAYPLDVFTDFDPSTVDALLQAHTHLVTSDSSGSLESALQRAFDETIGIHDATFGRHIKDVHRPEWASVPDAEAMILWLRHALPERAPDILARAERYYRVAS